MMPSSVTCPMPTRNEPTCSAIVSRPLAHLASRGVCGQAPRLSPYGVYAPTAWRGALQQVLHNRAIRFRILVPGVRGAGILPVRPRHLLDLGGGALCEVLDGRLNRGNATVRREERREALEVMAGVDEHGVGLMWRKHVMLITNDIDGILACQEGLRDLEGFPIIAMGVGDRLAWGQAKGFRKIGQQDMPLAGA